jgi:HK97 gp10 family phage protein
MAFQFIPNPLIEQSVMRDMQVHAAVVEVAEQGAQIAAANAPVETGALRASIASASTEDGAQVTVDIDYWAYVEFGTTYMAAQPFLRPVIDQLGLHR